MDGVTFEASEASGLDAFREQLRPALVPRTSRPRRWRQKAMPQEGGHGPRILSRPTSRDRVVQGAFKLILAPICEADFQPGAYGYRPKRSAHDAVRRVAEASGKDKTRVSDVALKASFDTIRQHLLVAKVAPRVNAPDVLQGRKLRLKVAGKKGGAPGGGLSPLLSHLSLTEGERMLERATAVTRRGSYTSLE